MRKKLIITNALSVLITLLILLTITIYTISKVNYNNEKKELKNYLALVKEMYDGNNGQEIINNFKQIDQNIRITFIDLEGNVFLDSIKKDEENHLNRIEVSKLGSVIKRHSDTLNLEMIYIATLSNQTYIRVAIPYHSITPTVNKFITVGVVSIVIILSISIIIMWPINKSILKPLNDVLYRLSKLAKNTEYVDNDSIESISYNIDQIGVLLQEQMKEITIEKEKFEYLVNSINQGLMVINKEGNITLTNKYIKKIFKVSPEVVENKNYLYTIRDTSVQQEIKKALDGDDYKPLDIHIGKFTYLVNITKVLDKVILLILDVTKERNIEEMKREFFANASHELKSPLTSIIGYQQLINEGIIDNPVEIKEATNKTIIEARRMNSIIIEMLELSKIESNFQYEKADIKLDEMIKEIVSSLEPKIKEKNLTINLELQPFTISMALSHATGLLKNLIDNAIKYNKDNGSINIILDKNHVEITDTGIGIASRYQSRIFERFYRVDKAKSKSTGGTGLGLAIVKHICNIYHFEIEVNSTLNKGTTFIVKFND